MKKRLLSMLMAVLMIASLVPAAALADSTTAGDHLINIKADATAKQPGIIVDEVKGEDGVVNTYDVTITPFVKKADICDKHTPVVKELVVASCGKAGLSVTYCSVCGSDLNKKVETPALKHDCDITVQVAPVCSDQKTASGWGYAVCKKCGEPFAVNANTDFKKILEQGKTESDTAYGKRVADAVALFTSADHDYKAVTADLKKVNKDTNKEYIAAYAAKDATHVSMLVENEVFINLNYQWADGGYVTKAIDKFADLLAEGKIVEVNGNAVAAGVVCTKCETVKTPGGETRNSNLNVTHAQYITVKDNGTRPVDCGDGSYKDGKTATYFCSVCNKTFGGEVISAAKWFNVTDTAEVKIGDTKIYEGEKVYQLVGTEIKEVAAANLNKATPATCEKVGNTGDVIIYTAAGAADENGVVPGVWMFSKKGTELKQLDHHFVAKADEAATCEKPGTHYVGVYKCDNVVGKNADGTDKICKEETTDVVHSTTTIPAKHNPTEVVLVEATCQHGGLNAVKCTICGKYLDSKTFAAVADGVIPAYETKVVKNHVAADELANVKEATCTEKGYTGDVVCKWCNTVITKGEETDLADHKFVNGKCEVCGAEDPDYVANPFKDLKETDRFYKEIIWAANEGIVKGDDKGNYNADATLTRAQVVTMLWRQAGEQKATKAADFTDLTQDWYKEAVAWAVENGITDGIGDGKFDPNGECTRAQFVTFLWRANNKPAATAAADFTDLTQGWYKDAVAWAVENNVTNGIGDGKFAPDAGCTRGQAAAFLYRLANPAK